MRWIEIFSPVHIKLLSFFDDPVGFAQKRGISYSKDWYMGGLSQPLMHALPELAGKREIFDPIIRELNGLGLLNIDSVHVMITAASYYERRTTEQGRRFLKFITEP